jgi:hypothetical protein
MALLQRGQLRTSHCHCFCFSTHPPTLPLHGRLTQGGQLILPGSPSSSWLPPSDHPRPSSASSHGRTWGLHHIIMAYGVAHPASSTLDRSAAQSWTVVTYLTMRSTTCKGGSTDLISRATSHPQGSRPQQPRQPALHYVIQDNPHTLLQNSWRIAVSSRQQAPCHALHNKPCMA